MSTTIHLIDITPSSGPPYTLRLVRNGVPVGDPFPGTVRAGTSAIVGTIPVSVANDLSPGDYTIRVNTDDYDGVHNFLLLLSLFKTPILPQVYTYFAPPLATDHFLDPDHNPATNDQLLDWQTIYFPLGLGTPRDHYSLSQSNVITDLNHKDLGVEFVVEHTWPFNGFFFGLHATYDRDHDTYPGDSCNTTIAQVRNWSANRQLFDNYGGMADDAPSGGVGTCSNPPDYVDSTGAPGGDPDNLLTGSDPMLFADSFRAESLNIPATTGQALGFRPRGQDWNGKFNQSDLQQVDPFFILDWSNPSAIAQWANRVSARAQQWETVPNYYYGSSFPEFFWFSEAHMQWAELFHDGRYHTDLFDPLLYFNSPTYSASALANFRTWCAQDSQRCGGLGNSALFPALACDFSSAIGTRTMVVDPATTPGKQYWDDWVAWRYQLVADTFASIAAPVKDINDAESNRIGFGLFYTAAMFPWRRAFDLVDTDATRPADRRWYYSKGENVFPDVTAHCRPTVYVDEGIDIATIEKTFRNKIWDASSGARGINLEWVVVEEHISAEAERTGLDDVQQMTNEINRNRGDLTGNSKFPRLKTAALMNMFPEVLQGVSFFEMKLAGLTTPPCAQEPTFNLLRPRTVLAQLKNAGFDGVSVYNLGEALASCNGGVVRTPYFDVWRAMTRKLTEETVAPRTINANLARNASFESRAVGPTLPDFWKETQIGTGTVSLVRPIRNCLALAA